MARWEPGARERLVVAAIDLFTERGYDATTVAQIAERAGVTKSTFFRHFPDKRELLVAGQRYYTVGGQLPTIRDSQSHRNTEAGRAASGRWLWGSSAIPT